jgi:hypothetical protein
MTFMLLRIGAGAASGAPALAVSPHAFITTRPLACG